ncbi:histidine phosphatase family protein [Sporolactobacillus shoreicorticis]|uniref:Histidine phosphatase family protein n=1 Tax=Sporolactobacillus shoreicorticis TaxID=1923877 RepID=A0ABW5S4S0_9BACL|nr:histidine phosphatase family protein [Sporolactobacillus shoreicorticis]MCO7127651.1 histidine phosphatase family protein [Sporolactobacillus shoreicorticis]
MTTICLVRHGETDWNAMGKLQGREDIPLNERGRKQAEMVGESLQSVKFSAVVTSPLLRAKQTAEIINKFVGKLPLIENADFIEKAYGKASGLTIPERDEQFPDGVIPGMEPIDLVRKRVIHGLSAVKQSFPGQPVLLVAHGGLINVILALLSGGKIGTGKTKLFNTCISHIATAGDSWEILDYNRIDHLSKFGKVTSI